MLTWLETLKNHDYTGMRAQKQFSEIIKKKQMEMSKQKGVKKDEDISDDEIPTKKQKKSLLD